MLPSVCDWRIGVLFIVVPGKKLFIGCLCIRRNYETSKQGFTFCENKTGTIRIQRPMSSLCLLHFYFTIRVFFFNERGTEIRSVFMRLSSKRKPRHRNHSGHFHPREDTQKMDDDFKINTHTLTKRTEKNMHVNLFVWKLLTLFFALSCFQLPLKQQKKGQTTAIVVVFLL